jgi:hypothetical protein
MRQVPMSTTNDNNFIAFSHHVAIGRPVPFFFGRFRVSRHMRPMRVSWPVAFAMTHTSRSVASSAAGSTALEVLAALSATSSPDGTAKPVDKR